MTWFEDMKIGASVELGNYTFEETEMVAFAKRYDPRDYLIDHVAAAAGPFGKLVASPWLITAQWMQMMVAMRGRDFFKNLSKPSPDGHKAQIGPSPGFLNLTWKNPVASGDKIFYSVKVHELITLKSRPQWGIVRNLNEGRNQMGESVMRFLGQVLMEKKYD